ncbi:hypothetical protein ACHAXM_006717 [Skeletonema potamos]
MMNDVWKKTEKERRKNGIWYEEEEIPTNAVRRRQRPLPYREREMLPSPQHNVPNTATASKRKGLLVLN